jgi:hypothetical protein
MVTESDRLSEGLTRAAELWPEVSHDKGQLLRRLVDTGIDAVLEESVVRTQERANAIQRVAGSLGGVWPDSWREGLRDEWPA